MQACTCVDVHYRRRAFVIMKRDDGEEQKKIEYSSQTNFSSQVHRRETYRGCCGGEANTTHPQTHTHTHTTVKPLIPRASGKEDGCNAREI